MDETLFKNLTDVIKAGYIGGGIGLIAGTIIGMISDGTEFIQKNKESLVITTLIGAIGGIAATRAPTFGHSIWLGGGTVTALSIPICTLLAYDQGLPNIITSIVMSGALGSISGGVTGFIKFKSQ